MLLLAAAVLVLCSSACTAVVVNPSLSPSRTGGTPVRDGGNDDVDPAPLVKSVFLTNANVGTNTGSPSLRRRVVGNGIAFQGGPVMLGTVNVFYIWYGAWNDASTTDILVNLASHIGETRILQNHCGMATLTTGAHWWRMPCTCAPGGVPCNISVLSDCG